MDVDGATYERFDDLVVYCRRVAGSIGRLCVAVYGSDDDRAGDLADGRPTPLMMYRCFADLGVYPYVSMAPEGGYDMARFPSIRDWLARVEARLRKTIVASRAPSSASPVAALSMPSDSISPRRVSSWTSSSVR